MFHWNSANIRSETVLEPVIKAPRPPTKAARIGHTEPATAATIERAHLAAIGDALRFIETHALYTRTGHNGVRQVDVTGLVAARFTHRDSRAGDPDLHTHVPVANKVQTLDGRWLSIDGRLLFKAIVARPQEQAA